MGGRSKSHALSPQPPISAGRAEPGALEAHGVNGASADDEIARVGAGIATIAPE
jgi:hypothetical protein